LTGTPLENKLEELFSVVEFVDGRRLGPAFRFLKEHRMLFVNLLQASITEFPFFVLQMDSGQTIYWNLISRMQTS
jgi:hypothetical protein